MSKLLNRLFSIRPGEENKTILLYVLHFIFYVGMAWGDYAREASFLNAWSADDLALMFVGNALLAFGMGILYTFFADRISNERLLIVMSWMMIGWLISVRVLLVTNGGPRGAVYPYFYLVYDAFRILSTMHILTYINDFYDTRAAKGALPLIASAGIAGSMIAGFTVPFLNRTIGLKNVSLAWAVCLLVGIGLIYLIRWRLSHELSEIRKEAQKARRAALEGTAAGAGRLENVSAGFRFVRRSSMLRWLAVATFAMVVLMNMLNFQSNQIFAAHYAGDPEGLFTFYGILGGISNVVGLFVQAVILNRLIARFGVGAMTLLFPMATVLSVGVLNFFPNMATAITGRLDQGLIKRTFRNPLDAMLYNSLPLQVKSRAKGFVNGLVVPLGTLFIGFVLLWAQWGSLPGIFLVAIGVVTALVYVVSAIKTRTGYGRSLADLLADDDMAIFRMSQTGFEQADPATFNFLYRRLDESKDDETAIFLAEVIYQVQGRAAFPRLCDLARSRGPEVRAGVIQMLGADWVDDPAVCGLCKDGLGDESPSVRRASVLVLAGDPKVSQDEEMLNVFLGLLQDPDEGVRAGVIPPLIASGDFYYLAPAVRTLSDWLSSDTDSRRRAMGLRVLAKTGAERMIRTLVRYLDDPEPLVRRQAVELIDDMAAQTPLEDVKKLGLETLCMLLSDDDEMVRMTAANGLGRFKSMEASRALLGTLGDESFNVRKQVCVSMNPVPTRELEKFLDDDDPYRVETSAFVLARSNNARARRRVQELMEQLVAEALSFHALRLPLQDFDTPGARLLSSTLREEAEYLLDRAFWLLGALGKEDEAENIYRSLQSEASTVRANAAEMLETLTSPHLARLVAPLYDGTDLETLVKTGREVLGPEIPTGQEVFSQLWPQLDGLDGKETSSALDDGWLRAVTAYTLAELDASEKYRAVVSRESLVGALRADLEDESPLVRETARKAIAQISGSDTPGEIYDMEEPMLTIEKVIFLKDVPFFGGMNINQLRTLAGISEEVSFEEGEQIFAEGGYGDALHVIVSGRVGIQRQKAVGRRVSITRLATLGPREYFAEMSIFDNQPHSADAVALERTNLLLVRQSTLVALIRRQPDLALGLLKVLGQRLRQANVIIAEKTRAQPKKMMDVYDKLDMDTLFGEE